MLHRISQINYELRRLQPAVHPFAAQILPLLKDFPTLWQQLTTVEQRSLLQAMFTDVFFDPAGEPRFILANSPFEALLKITAGELPVSGTRNRSELFRDGFRRGSIA